MGSLFKPAKQLALPLAVTLMLTIYQLVRVIAFISVYGGIEHDGGWMLSISRSLAEQGTYTTMVSTIVDPAALADVNIDQKFDVQAPDGRIWFFTGNGIGPASIIPDAVILKLFGTDFWALHAGPLLFYTAFLLLGAYILYQLAGLGALLLFHAFLFFYPHLSIFLGYEAMGEVPGVVYVLWAYLAFAAAAQKQRRRPLFFLLAGVVMGLAISAKLITLWSISGILIWAGILWLSGLAAPTKRLPDAQPATESAGPAARPGRVNLAGIAGLAGGLLLPVVLWELVHLVVLSRLGDFELYLRHARQRIDFILDDGSGLGLRTHTGAEFFWDKFFLLSEVAHPQRWVTAALFAGLLVGGLALVWLWRSRPYKQDLMAPIWLGWLANTAWFVGLAQTGWPRHFWFGLVLAVLLLCIISVALLRPGRQMAKTAVERIGSGMRPAAGRLPLLAGTVLLLLIGWGFWVQPHVRGFFVPDEIVPYWREKQINHKYGASLPWIITPRAAQAEAVAFLQQLPPEANIYYPAQHKAAEIAAQVGRVLYPLGRRKFMQPHPQDVALVSPTLIAPWLEPVRREALLELVYKDCPQPLLTNDYYMICPLPSD